MGADLLRLATGQADRPLSEFERVLAGDIEEILLVRVPQFPSSRAWGDWPVESSVEYTARVPKNPTEQKIIPVPPRRFPDELRDPRSPPEPWLRSDYAVAGLGAGDCCAIRVHPAPALGIIRLCLPTSSAACCTPSRS